MTERSRLTFALHRAQNHAARMKEHLKDMERCVAEANAEVQQAYRALYEDQCSHDGVEPRRKAA